MASDNELPEKEFIHEGYRKRPTLLWIFLALVVVIFTLFWVTAYWQRQIFESRVEDSPFLQVTNREFSLFLWQNPHLMRAFMKRKFGYLPHFSSDDDIHVIPDRADAYVSAPPEILFLYHTWNRLLGKTLAPRPIPSALFQQFLEEDREWLPEFWSAAPVGYQQLVREMPDENLETLSMDVLPFEVRFAFQGWRNYFLEREEIEAVRPTIEEMELFLQRHAHYSRSYWRNILEQAAPEYLISFLFGKLRESSDPSALLPEEELTYFLRVGFYNDSKVTNPSS